MTLKLCVNVTRGQFWLDEGIERGNGVEREVPRALGEFVLLLMTVLTQPSLSHSNLLQSELGDKHKSLELT